MPLPSGIPTPRTTPNQLGVFATEIGDVDSIYFQASVTAPIAGQAIATLLAANLPVGVYEVFAEVGYVAGAPAAAEANNMQLQKGGVAVGTGALPTPAALGINTFGPFRVSFDGATTLRVVAVAAGTAGVVYSAAFTVRQVA